MQVDIFTFLLIIWPKALAIVSVAVRFKVSVVIIRILRASVLSAHKKLEKIRFLFSFLIFRISGSSVFYRVANLPLEKVT